MQRLLKILFPPECLHCKQGHDQLKAPLCRTCFSHLEILPAENLLVTFSSLSPAKSLVHALKRGVFPESAKLLAAYMAIQYTQSAFPLPDLITIIPSHRFRRFSATEPLAQELSKLLERPFIPLLRRHRQLLRQDFLEREQRVELSSDDFAWANKMCLRGKTLLLIDDTITTGTTLQCCAEHLWQTSPSQVIKMACLDQGYLKE